MPAETTVPCAIAERPAGLRRAAGGHVPPSRYSDAAFRAFDAFFQPWRARRLRTAPPVGLPRDLPADRPLVMVANHTSWWDGFLLRDVHRALRPGAPMYTLMAARELERRPFFRLLGAVPVREGSAAGTLHMLRCLRRWTTERPDASVIVFPQGRIGPSGRRPPGFRRGVELIIRAVAPCRVLPVALHVEALNHAAPTAFIVAAPVIDVDTGLDARASVPALEGAVTARLDALTALLNEHGEDAVHRLAEIA
jgi:1-acyl-sn-glycerol-3-phosphate acyltransferase